MSCGRLGGPYQSPSFPGFKVSPIGRVAKRAPGQYRLIHHLSFPEGLSINDNIDPKLKTVSYACFDDAVQLLLQLGPGSFFSKSDIADAYRIVPVHPNDNSLLGFKFNGSFYYDKCLPMGASSSCCIFERFGSNLEWIAKEVLKIPSIIHILDDFLIMGPAKSPQCQHGLDRFLSMCNSIGVPIKAEKTVQPTTTITFMGLELDSINMVARLPDDKLLPLRERLNVQVKLRKITLQDLQSLIGLLNFCCSVEDVSCVG